MHSSILGLATATPTHTLTQARSLELMVEMFPEHRKILQNLYLNSGIDQRHMIMDDFNKERAQWDFWGASFPKTIPTMTERNQLYKREAPLLAREAAHKAINAWGGDPASLTHIISVSCTGAVIPGIEFKLIHALGLKRTIYRLGINFMGCFGAFKGLQVANAFAQADPKNRILVVCTELCSLHFQTDPTSDNMLASSIFGDGAAAVIVGSTPHANEKPLWELIKHASFGLENSLDQMAWEASDHGYLIKLSGFVPLTLAKHIQSFATPLVESLTTADLCDWAIHPGGKAILQVIEKKLHLDSSQTRSSWKTLAENGNMSSATFLFVLENLMHQSEQKTWTVGLGFGPGLSMEGILLRKP